MRRLHLVPFAALLGVSLLAAGASAARGDDACEADDIDGFSFFFAHDDGTFESSNLLDLAREGDLILASGSADLDCEDVPFTFVSYTRVHGAVDVFEEDVGPAFRPRPTADFVAIESDVEVPECTFRVQLLLGTRDNGRILDERDGGTRVCSALPPPACPAKVSAFSEGGRVTLTWVEDERATTLRILRAEGDAPLSPYAEVPRGQGSFVDEAVAPGVAYRYVVLGANASGVSEGCPEVTITAVPFFGHGAVGALALVGALGTFVVMRRR